MLVIVCTLMGASPPTGTEPTMICRERRRSMFRQGRIGLWVMGKAPIGWTHGLGSRARPAAASPPT